MIVTVRDAWNFRINHDRSRGDRCRRDEPYMPRAVETDAHERNKRGDYLLPAGFSGQYNVKSPVSLNDVAMPFV